MPTANLGRVGFVNKYEFVNGTPYKMNDIVKYQGNIYACKVANSGELPTNNAFFQLWVGDLSSYTKEELSGSFYRIASPLLHANFKNGLNLITGAGGINYSRATTATYISMLDVLTTAGINEPRFEKKGLRCSVGSTNLADYSSDFSQWANVRASAVVSTTELGIDGETYMNELLSDSSNGTHYTRNIVTALVADNSPLTVSAVVKAGRQTWCSLAIRTKDALLKRVYFNISTGTVGTASVDSYSIEHISDGKYLVSATLNDIGIGASEVSGQIFPATSDGSASFLGDGGITPELYIENGQIEALPFATTRIFTTTTTVTRSADVLSIDSLNNMPNILDPITVSWVGEIVGTEGVFRKVFSSGDMGLNASSSAINDNYSYVYKDGGASTPTVLMPSNKFNFTATYNPDTTTLRMYHNGVIVAEDVTASTSDARNTLIILMSGIEGWIESLKIWDFVLTDTEIKLELGI